MCGIVGLHLRTPELYPRLGELLAGMLCEMSNRGSDSAGVALYGDPTWTPPGRGCVSLLEVDGDDESNQRCSRFRAGRQGIATTLGATRLLTADADSETLLTAARAAYPGVLVAGFGADLAVLKGVGDPATLTRSWGLDTAQGWQGVGHTRMATESAVTPSGAHPYAVDPNSAWCTTARSPTTPPSDANYKPPVCDSTARTTPRSVPGSSRAGWQRAATWRPRSRNCAPPSDGFYTLLVSNRDSFAVVRDAIACKPAVIAETDDWVAMGSEYRALSGLPGVEKAAIWEPEPEVVYAWTR